MGTYRKSASLASAQARRFSRIERSIQIEHRRLAEEMLGVAIQQTSGQISSAELRRRGHPFGRGMGRRNLKRGLRGGVRGVAPKLPINAQTGALRRSWRLFRRTAAHGLVYQLQPTHPHAIVLLPGGTKRMVARGFWTTMRQEFRKRNRLAVQRMRYQALLEARKG